MNHNDVEGGIRAKVLGELMQHMISLHGKSASSPSLDASIADKPSEKLPPIEEIEVKRVHDEPVVEEKSELGDLFGRKKKSGMVEF